MFKNHLTNRTHRVRFGKAISEPLALDIGVPQGSILGPILFLIYINDLSHISPLFTPILYADDTTLLITNTNTNDLLDQCEISLRQFQTWSLANKLTINEKKSHFMTLTHRRGIPPITCKIHDKIVNQVNSIRFLGIHIDDKLKFNSHTDYLANKISTGCPKKKWD